MPRPTLPPITDEEEARIQAGIATDPDNPEIIKARAAQARERRPRNLEAARRLRLRRFAEVR